MKPAEGTVLTVSRLAAQRALEAAGERNDAAYVLEEAIKTGYTTLAETIEMNPVLKKAGVGGCRRQGLPHHPGGYAPFPCGARPSLRWRKTAEEKCRFRRHRRRGHHLSPSDTVFTVRKTSGQAPWTACGPTWAASATAWSSARTMSPSRSTSIPTPRRRPERGAEVRHAGAGQDREYAYPGRRPGGGQEGPKHR